MVNNLPNVGTVLENCFNPVCNTRVNRLKKFRSSDSRLEHKELSSDGIKERLCPIGRLQTLRTNLHQTMDRNSDRLLKLNPYPILDSDPTLNNLNYSNLLSKSPHTLGK